MVASPRLAASLRQSSSSQRRQLHKLAPSPAYPPEIANQTIAPYTDLLHGPRPHFQAAGQEWRTPPLWGLGISEAVNGYTSFRQDGRAQGVREASRWHGGEALGRRRELSATSRAALAAFSKSL